MEFIDLKTQQKRIGDKINGRIKKVLEQGQYIQGPEVVELETQLAKWVGVKHCLTCANGTDALQIAMMAIDIKPGDEVITTPFTFAANVEMIGIMHAKPVFVDINPKTYNIDVTKIESAVTHKTRAIMPVSLYGQVAELDDIMSIAQKYRLVVIEDAAQSFGAAYKGRKSCAITPLSTTSFFPSKPLGCYGDGGALFTTNDEWAERIKIIRSHGQKERYTHVELGVNSRLDTIQAAILLEKLSIFDEEILLRDKVGTRYTEALKRVFKTPHIESYNQSVYAQYTIEVENRDAMRAHLQKNGIPTAVHYPKSLHLQKAYEYLGCKAGDFLNSEYASEHVLSLPMHPYLSERDQDTIINCIKSFS